MNRYILLRIFFMLIVGLSSIVSASGQDGALSKDVTIKGKKKFMCYFVENNEKEEIEFEVIYCNKNGNDSLTIYFKNELLERDSCIVDAIDAELIRNCLNKKLTGKAEEDNDNNNENTEGDAIAANESPEKKKVYRILTQTSFWEVYIWIRNLAYGVEARPVAGRFKIASFSKMYVAGVPENGNLFDIGITMHHHAIDSIAAKIESLQAEVGDYTKRLQVFDEEIQKIADSLRKDDQAVESKKLVEISLDSFNMNIKKTASDKTKNPDIQLYDSVKVKLQTYIKFLSQKAQRKVEDLFFNDINRIEKLIKLPSDRPPSEEQIAAIKYLMRAQIFRKNDGAHFANLENWISNPPITAMPESLRTYFLAKKDVLYRELTNRLNLSIENVVAEAIVTTTSTISETKDPKKEREELKSAKLLLQEELQRIRKLGIVEINRVDLQIERGFLENVKVIADINGVEQIFENVFAIGFTSKRNFKNLAKIKLFERNSGNFLYLGDILRSYDNELDLYTRDYAPADTSIKVYPARQPEIEVYKAPFSRLFDAKVFTDFAAFSNNSTGESGNGSGMIQLEVSRKLNLNTFRIQQYQDRNIGLFNYVYLFGSLNKVERQNRHLSLRNDQTSIGGTIVSPNYVSTLDVLEYRNFMLGGELNTLLFDLPTAKSTFTLDFGAQYGHTPIVDSGKAQSLQYANLSPQYRNASMVLFYPKIGLELFSERRVGVSMAYYLYYTQLFTNNHFKQVASYAKSNTGNGQIEPYAKFVHMFEYNVRAELDRAGSNSLFLRARLFWQQKDMNTYFPQIQFGYSYLLKTSQF